MKVLSKESFSVLIIDPRLVNRRHGTGLAQVLFNRIGRLPFLTSCEGDYEGRRPSIDRL